MNEWIHRIELSALSRAPAQWSADREIAMGARLWVCVLWAAVLACTRANMGMTFEQAMKDKATQRKHFKTARYQRLQKKAYAKWTTLGWAMGTTRRNGETTW